MRAFSTVAGRNSSRLVVDLRLEGEAADDQHVEQIDRLARGPDHVRLETVPYSGPMVIAARRSLPCSS